MLRLGERQADRGGSAATKDGRLAELEQALETLLAGLEARCTRNDLTLHDPLLALAKTHVAQAIAVGAGAGHGARLERLLHRVARENGVSSGLEESRTPHLNGVVLQSEPVILRSHQPWIKVPQRRRAADRDATQESDARVSRRFKRYATPALWVSVEGLHYRTLDWSIGGLALLGTRKELALGREVRVTLAAEIRDPRPPIFADRAVVVGCEPQTGHLFLHFRNAASAGLKILEYLSRRRIEPVEASG